MRKPGHIAVSSLYMPVLAEPLFPASPMVLPISSSVEPVVILNQEKSLVAQAVDGGVGSLAIAGAAPTCAMPGWKAAPQLAEHGAGLF